jgi:lipopolysaccharide/colanic/teichoic acid biosynthesis glycosyltransferase
MMGTSNGRFEFPGFKTMKDGIYSRVGKPCFDAAVASTGLVLLAPLFLLAAAAIKLTSRGPVFFRQIRVGQFGTPFRIFKFRTMTGTTRGRGSLLTAAGDPRITALGRWLRKTKIDELPQLMNVVCGDMSLVGPRPEVPEYVAQYTKSQRQILRVKPGMTGRAANDYIDEELLLAGQPDKEAFYVSTILPAKLEYDLAYSKRVRFRDDLLIILETLGKVCNRFAVPRGRPLGSPDSQG